MGLHQNNDDFKYCKFCANDSTRRDNLKFSHWLFDKTTREITCPFLLNTICHICREYGHTTQKCQNQFRIQELHMATLTVDPQKSRIAQFEYEKELERRFVVDAYLNMNKHCAFCAGGNYHDDFYKTHNLSTCPRLACMTCTYCGCKGHTTKKCDVKATKALWDNADPSITEYILDFDAPQ